MDRTVNPLSIEEIRAAEDVDLIDRKILLGYLKDKLSNDIKIARYFGRHPEYADITRELNAILEEQYDVDKELYRRHMLKKAEEERTLTGELADDQEFDAAVRELTQLRSERNDQRIAQLAEESLEEYRREQRAEAFRKKNEQAAEQWRESQRKLDDYIRRGVEHVAQSLEEAGVTERLQRAQQRTARTGEHMRTKIEKTVQAAQDKLAEENRQRTAQQASALPTVPTELSPAENSDLRTGSLPTVIVEPTDPPVEKTPVAPAPAKNSTATKAPVRRQRVATKQAHAEKHAATTQQKRSGLPHDYSKQLARKKQAPALKKDNGKENFDSFMDGVEETYRSEAAAVTNSKDQEQETGVYRDGTRVIRDEKEAKTREHIKKQMSKALSDIKAAYVDELKHQIAEGIQTQNTTIGGKPLLYEYFAYIFFDKALPHILSELSEQTGERLAEIQRETTTTKELLNKVEVYKRARITLIPEWVEKDLNRNLLDAIADLDEVSPTEARELIDEFKESASK